MRTTTTSKSCQGTVITPSYSEFPDVSSEEVNTDQSLPPVYLFHSHPLPFPCSAKLRDEKARALVETLPEKT